MLRARPLLRQLGSRRFYEPGTRPAAFAEYLDSYDAPKSTTFQFRSQIPKSLVGDTITVRGFLGKRRDISSNISFVPLSGGNDSNEIQIFACSAQPELKQISPYSPVTVTGVLDWKKLPKNHKAAGETPDEGNCFINQLEIKLQSIQSLNDFPKDLADDPGKMSNPQYRFLQIRLDHELRERLLFRSKVASYARRQLESSDFVEIETPLLFKSTPEGAREFLVPTRDKNYAYALPQSPQQYKQILMAGGIHRYFQFARCFRDEDHRADRQPEFTQIDLEMAFANGQNVMLTMENLIKSLWSEFAKPKTVISEPLPLCAFPRITYDESMSKYGSDKPDWRIPGQIHRVDHFIPSDLRSMVTPLANPIIEVCKFRLSGGDASTTWEFVKEFMDSADAEDFIDNPAGGPGIFVFDARKRPLEGLEPFRFEAAESVKAMFAESKKDTELDHGDLLILQARESSPRHSGGSTMLGKLRLTLYNAAVSKKLIEPDSSHHFLWVTDFPLFTPNNDSDPGQRGDSGFSATHHPFTAPKDSENASMLLNKDHFSPLDIKADHYDLVLNGVELGGGSARIHNSEVQQFIMREVLKMKPEGMESFSHLFEALRSGCPPHAGFAIGFDRLIAMMTGQESVRDVIAFPKDKKGRDLMAKAPGLMTDEQRRNYHLLP